MRLAPSIVPRLAPLPASCSLSRMVVEDHLNGQLIVEWRAGNPGIRDVAFVRLLEGRGR